MHDELPTEVAGGGRSMITATAGLVNAYDLNLNPGGPPKTIQPGIVVNMPTVKLVPEGGPECSAKITSAMNSVTVGTGAELLFAIMVAR
jgi:hypothetical protein